MLLSIPNIAIYVFIILLIIICLILIIVMAILLSYCNFDIFAYASTNNCYCKLSLTYLYSLLKLDIIFHERLYVKFVNKLNFMKYNAIFKTKDKKTEDTNKEKDLVHIDENNISFEKNIDITEDFIREEKEYIKKFNENNNGNITPSIKDKLIQFRNNFVLRKENIKNIFNKYFSEKAFDYYNFVLEELKCIFNNIHFTKFTVNVEFGLEDNYYMSKLLIFFSLFYTMFKNFNAKPIYNTNVLKGYVIIKGKFNLFGFIKPAFRLLTNKDFIKFLKELFGEIKLWKIQKKKLQN